MPSRDNRDIISIQQEVTNTAHKAQYCAACGRSINRHKTTVRVYQVTVQNDYGQESSRHACWTCVRKDYAKRLKSIPERINNNRQELLDLQEESRNLMEILGVKEKPIKTPVIESVDHIHEEIEER